MSHDHKNKRRDDNLKCHCNTAILQYCASINPLQSAGASGFVTMEVILKKFTLYYESTF